MISRRQEIFFHHRLSTCKFFSSTDCADIFSKILQMSHNRLEVSTDNFFRYSSGADNLFQQFSHADNFFPITIPPPRCTFQLLEVSGSADRGGGGRSIQFINFGRVADKSLKEWRRKIFVLLYSIKECHFPVDFYTFLLMKETGYTPSGRFAIWTVFLFVLVKFRNS